MWANMKYCLLGCVWVTLWYGEVLAKNLRTWHQSKSVNFFSSFIDCVICLRVFATIFHHFGWIFQKPCQIAIFADPKSAECEVLRLRFGKTIDKTYKCSKYTSSSEWDFQCTIKQPGCISCIYLNKRYIIFCWCVHGKETVPLHRRPYPVTQAQYAASMQHSILQKCSSLRLWLGACSTNALNVCRCIASDGRNCNWKWKGHWLNFTQKQINL